MYLFFLFFVLVFLPRVLRFLADFQGKTKGKDTDISVLFGRSTYEICETVLSKGCTCKESPRVGARKGPGKDRLVGQVQMVQENPLNVKQGDATLLGTLDT